MEFLLMKKLAREQQIDIYDWPRMAESGSYTILMPILQLGKLLVTKTKQLKLYKTPLKQYATTTPESVRPCYHRAESDNGPILAQYEILTKFRFVDSTFINTNHSVPHKYADVFVSAGFVVALSI